MLCKCYWIVLFTVHVTAFCLGGRFFPGHGVVTLKLKTSYSVTRKLCYSKDDRAMRAI